MHFFNFKIRTFHLILILAFVLNGCSKDDKNTPSNTGSTNDTGGDDTVPVPNALFTFRETEKGLITFTNQSENALTYLWDFGDSTTSTEENPVHQFGANGNFHVVLKAINMTKSDTTGAEVVIEDFPTDRWTWTGEFPGGKRSRMIYFTVNDKFYAGFGYKNFNTQQDLWEYDLKTGNWTQKNDGPAPILDGVCFVIGNYAYVGLGESNQSPNTSFWKYDPSNDSWTRLGNYPGNGGFTTITGATAFSDGVHGYVVNGKDAFTLDTEFWIYDPAGDHWTRSADFPGSARHFSSQFILNNKIYICCGAESLGAGNDQFYNDLWEYDPVRHTWTERASLPGPGRMGATGFAIDGKGYVGMGGQCPYDSFGSAYAENYSDLWEYDPDSDEWTERSSFPDVTRIYPYVIEFSDHILIGGGKGTYGTEKSDIYEYRPR